MPKIHELATYTDELLGVDAIPDYPAALNGLQLENGSEITGLAGAVDFSTRAIKGAIAARANLLIVHHGMFWGGSGPLIGPSYRRLRLLLENDVAVYSSHLPLDRHEALGNNALLAGELGLTPSEPFANFEGIYIGTSGETEINTAELVDRVQRFASAYNTAVRSTEVKETRLTKKQQPWESTLSSSAKDRTGLLSTLKRTTSRSFTPDTTRRRRLEYARWRSISQTNTEFLPALSARRLDSSWRFGEGDPVSNPCRRSSRSHATDRSLCALSTLTCRHRRIQY
jgi:putative NIF3 family GTP cyclohydrolase 1 type 2